MKIAIMGAGAVGCCYGAWAAEAGHEVVLIGRPALVEAVETRGLLFESGGETRAIPMRASADPAAVAGAQLVLVCVKSGDTEETGRLIGPHLSSEAAVLSMQNGVGNAQRLAAAMGAPAIPVAVYVAAGMGGPGHVQHFGRGDLMMGESPLSAMAAGTLRGCGIEVTVSDQAEAAQWAKLILNCAYNAASAITRLPYGRLVEQPGMDAVIAGAVAECFAVAAAEGIAPLGDVAASIASIPVTMAGQFSSTAQDMMRGRRTEIDFLNGEIVRRGAKHGVATPVNATLLALVKAQEAAQHA